MNQVVVAREKRRRTLYHARGKRATAARWFEAVRRPLRALGYDVVGELAVTGGFDRGKVKDSPQALTDAAALGTRLALSIA